MLRELKSSSSVSLRLTIAEISIIVEVAVIGRHAVIGLVILGDGELLAAQQRFELFFAVPRADHADRVARPVHHAKHGLRESRRSLTAGAFCTYMSPFAP